MCIEFQPPRSTTIVTHIYEVVVVLDCSGSMFAFDRDKKAKILLDALINLKSVRRVALICFGDTAHMPIYFNKDTPRGFYLPNMGGTNFHAALERLVGLLKELPKSDCRYFTIFISDGEAEHPTPWYAPLKSLLEEREIDLLSVAISNSADPELMVRLAGMRGGLGLHLIRDGVSSLPYHSDGMVRETLAYTPLEEVDQSLQVRMQVEGAESITKTLRYKEGEDVILWPPPSIDPSKLQVQIVLPENTFELELKPVNRAENPSRFLQYMVTFTNAKIRENLDHFVDKTLPAAEAAQNLRALKAAFNENFDLRAEMQALKERISSASPEEVTSLQQQKRELAASLQHVLFTTLERLNRALRVVENNELIQLLEVYTGRPISTKMSAQLVKVVQKNQQHNNVLPTAAVEEILNKEWSNEVPLRLRESCPALDGRTSLARPLGVCMLTLTSPVEDTPVEEISQNDWVGNACYINVGPAATLDPWRLASAVVHQFKLSDSGGQYLQQRNELRATGVMRGYEKTFNALLPVLDPEERIQPVLLSLQLMRKSVAGQQIISRYFTNSPLLFNPAMVNALYSVAALKTLTSAEGSGAWRTGMHVFFTLLAENLDAPFWGEQLQKLIGSPAAFIGSKDTDQLPDVARMLPLMCCQQEAYDLPWGVARGFFYLLTVRVIAEETSERFLLSDLVGFGNEDYTQRIASALIEAAGGRIEPFSNEVMGKNVEISPHLDRLGVIGGLYCQLRKYMEKRGITLKELYLLFLDNRIPPEDLEEMGKKAGAWGHKSLPKLLSVFLPAKSCWNMQPLASVDKKHTARELFQHWESTEHSEVSSVNALIQDIILICCEDHVGGLPVHNSQKIIAFIQKCLTIERLCFNAGIIRREFALKTFGKEAFRITKLIKRRKKILKWIATVRSVAQRFPLEQLMTRGEPGRLWFSGSDVVFANQQQKNSYLADWLFLEEDLRALEAMGLEEIGRLDFNKWKHTNRYFLPGLHRLSAQHVGACPTEDEFEQKIIAAYKEKWGRELTVQEIRKVQLLGRHYFQEFCLEEYIKEHRDSISLDLLCDKFLGNADEQKRKEFVDHCRALIHFLSS